MVHRAARVSRGLCDRSFFARTGLQPEAEEEPGRLRVVCEPVMKSRGLGFRGFGFTLQFLGSGGCRNCGGFRALRLLGRFWGSKCRALHCGSGFQSLSTGQVDVRL